MYALEIVCLVFSISCISSVYSGECCKTYTDITGDTHDPQWCGEYCCYDPSTLGLTYYCCGNVLLRAKQEMRDDSCVQWWEEHIYVPALVGVGFIVIVCLVCFCCCRFCRRQTPGYIIQSGQGTGQVVMVQQQQQQQQTVTTPQDPFRAGYNQ